MAELCEGGDAALSILISRWERSLFAFAMRYLQQAEDAADIVQESFVRVYQHRNRFRRGARFSTWLFAIAANLCKNRVRSRKRRPTVSFEFPDDESGNFEHPWLADSESVSPDQALLDQEQIAAVKRAISELPHNLKTALLLYQYEEMSYKEIAAIAGCSVKAVETRLYRARNLLKEKLKGFLKTEKPSKIRTRI